MTLGTLGQFALSVSNADASETFYGEVLGLTKLYRFDNLVFFDCDGVRLMLEGSEKPIPTSSGVCHYFKVNDIEKSVSALEANGLSFDDKPHLIHTMPDHELWMVFFHDPDGYIFGLMEERML